MELDPYKVLEVPYDADLKTIRENFKRLVLKNHPDRGGNPTIFGIIKNAYSYLYKYKIEQKEQLKKEQRNFNKYTHQRNFQTEELDREFQKIKINPNDKKIDNKKFNRIFDLHKIEDADDRGYSYERDNKREEPEELLKKYSNKKVKKMEVAVYEEPEPTELLDDNYKRIGLKHVKDFSKSHGRGESYTDFQRAYTEYDTQNMKNIRNKEYKDVEQYKQERNNQNFTMTESDRRKMEIKKREELTMEEKRRYYAKQQDKIAEKKFKSLQNYISFR